MNKILELDTDNCIDSFKGEALLIDDSIVAAKVASKVLEKLRFKTTICASAQDGFDVLKENSKRFAFVMLDIVMPNVDGVDVYHGSRMTHKFLTYLYTCCRTGRSNID